MRTEFMPMTDETVRGTNDDALISKLSAVQAGYLDDPFVKAFISRGPKRLPLINLGTYIRTTEIDRLIALNSPCQRVSFGAGSDTRPGSSCNYTLSWTFRRLFH